MGKDMRLARMLGKPLMAYAASFNGKAAHQLCSASLSSHVTSHADRQEGIFAALCRIFDRDVKERTQLQMSATPTLAKQKASAWYYVTYKESWDNSAPRNLFSFAWLAERVLTDIKRQAVTERNRATSPSA